MDVLHKHHYDLALATCSLVPNTGPILVKDQMEDWSAAEANSFEDAIEKCGKDFGEIQKEYVKHAQFDERTISSLSFPFSYRGKVSRESSNITTCGKPPIVTSFNVV